MATVTGERWQLLPELSAEEFATLKADIAERGVLVPVEVDQHGVVLDGHHRLRAVAELRAERVRVSDPARMVRVFGDDTERAGHVLAVNLVRRHLSPVQRADLVTRLRQMGYSYRRIAAAAGISEATARRDLGAALADAASGDAVELPERIVGRDGRSQPARRPTLRPTVFARSPAEERDARASLATLGEATPARLLDTRRARDLARTFSMRDRRAAGVAAGQLTGASFELRHGDFREVLAGLPDASVDLILTDPPYDDAHVPLWSDLSELAARVLKPGRALVAYAGQLRLAEEMARLGEHLDYVWAGATLLPGKHALMHLRQVANNHRVWLVFSAGPYTPRSWLFDTLETGESYRAKGIDEHPWRQAPGPFRALTRALSLPGELILDPFVGGGTVAVAAIAEGRRFLGCDCDPACVAMTSERMASQEAARAAGEQVP